MNWAIIIKENPLQFLKLTISYIFEAPKKTLFPIPNHLSRFRFTCLLFSIMRREKVSVVKFAEKSLKSIIFPHPSPEFPCISTPALDSPAKPKIFSLPPQGLSLVNFPAHANKTSKIKTIKIKINFQTHIQIRKVRNAANNAEIK